MNAVARSEYVSTKRTGPFAGDDLAADGSLHAHDKQLQQDLPASFCNDLLAQVNVNSHVGR